MTKRIWAMALAVIMVFGLLPVVQFGANAATVDYVTDNSTGYIYNWGTREEEATFSSPMADAFYTANETTDYTYDALSALSGATSLTDVKNSALYNALKTLMTSKHTNITSYQDTRAMYQYTDCQGSALLSNKISSFYSGAAIGPAWDGGATWNREHTWPNSKGMGGNDENDIMMLRPTASSENTDRGNTCYGESEGYYHPNSKSDGTYDLRGDVARIALYIYVRWGNTEKLWGPNTDNSGVIESKDILLDWIEADPVDTWELGRNDSVESITGTRNVFVDYPELAFLLFNEAIPAMATPSGEAMSSNIDYTLTAVSNDETMGTVTVSGNVINAIPAAGYYAQSYTVTAGTAEVTANGNVFKVNATADCTVQINFAKQQEVQISYLHNGTVAATDSYAYGTSFNLPAYTDTLPEGVVFLGWSEKAVTATETQPEVYPAGYTYTPSADTSLHAVYTYLDTADSVSGAWTLVTDSAQLYAGNKLLIANAANNTVAGNLSGNYMVNLTASFLADWMVQVPADAAVLTLGGQQNAWTLTNAEGKQLGETAAKSLSWTSGTNTWKISVADGNLTLSPTSNTHVMLYNVGFPRFTTYENLTGNMVLPQLYVYNTDAGSLHYASTLPTPCTHENTVTVPEQAPTATEAGWTEGTYCYDCDKYIDGHKKLAPTAACVVNFVVPEGITAIPNALCDANGIALPEAEAPEGYEFVGWTEAPVAETSEAPSFYEAGDTYQVFGAESTVLYALYSFAKEGVGSTVTTWKLAKSASDLAVGKEVIIAAKGSNYALSTTQNSNNRGQAAIVKSGDTLETPGSNVAILTLKNGSISGTYAFYTGSAGYLYAAGANSSNYLRTGTTLDEKSSFTITVAADGTCTVRANLAANDNARLDLRYNSSSRIFACYKVNTQAAVCLYVKTTTTGGSEMVTHYTTMIGEDACAHEATTFSGAVAPTCTQSGWTGKLVCNDCGAELTENQSISATGHAAATFVPAYTPADPCTEASWEAHYDCAECGKLVVSKTVDAAAYTLPVAPGHDCQADGTCSVCEIPLVTLGLTTVTLRASTPGIYYKGAFTIDESFEGSVEKYGITASVYNENPTIDDDSSKYTQGTVGALITDILDGTSADKANANQKIYARAYVELTDGRVVYSQVAAVSMRQLVYAIDARFDSLNATQKEALADLYDRFSVMASWNIPNLKAYIAAQVAA